MPLVSEDIPRPPGPNSSMAFGQATQSARLQREIESRVGNGNSPSAQPTPQPQALPVTGMPPVGQPVQPQVQAPPQAGRLDMDAVYPPMPEIDPTYPWRQAIRAAAYHPLAGPAMAHFASLIAEQKGPMGY